MCESVRVVVVVVVVAVVVLIVVKQGVEFARMQFLYIIVVKRE